MLKVCNIHNISFVVNNVNPDRNDCPVCEQSKRADSWHEKAQQLSIENSKLQAFITNKGLMEGYQSSNIPKNKYKLEWKRKDGVTNSEAFIAQDCVEAISMLLEKFPEAQDIVWVG